MVQQLEQNPPILKHVLSTPLEMHSSDPATPLNASSSSTSPEVGSVLETQHIEGNNTHMLHSLKGS